jgi:transcriptional regulator with XRE-family HTH domain
MQVLEDPADIRLTLIFLRILHGWNQTDLAERAGVNKSLISLYELEKQVPSGKTLGRLLSAFQISTSRLETVLRFVQTIRKLTRGSEEAATELVTRTAGLMGTTLQTALAQSLAALYPNPLPEELRTAPEQLGEWFRSSPPAMRKTLATELREYHTWSFCEWLCQEIERVLENDPSEALRLAQMAVEIASRVPVEDPPRQRLQGYAWAHLARARQASGDAPGADEAATQAREHWEACDPDDSDRSWEDRFLDLMMG